MSIADQLLELGLYRLLDLRAAPVSVIGLVVRAVVVGLLVVITFSLVDRFAGRRTLRPRAGRGV